MPESSPRSADPHRGANQEPLTSGVHAARALAAFAALLGGSAVLGWWIGIPVLTSIAPGYVTMKPNTALGLILGGLALWQLAPPADAPAHDPSGRTPRRTVGHVLALACAAVGAVTLCEYALGVRGVFDEVLARVPADAASTATPGRMAATTAAAFVVLGAGLLALDARRDRWARIGEWILAAGLSVPLAVVVGYVYHVIPTHGLGQGVQMALHTAAGCLALAVGGFLARPEREFVRALRSRGAGGLLARRLLPAALGVPVLLGALRLIGERAGVLDPAGGNAAVAVGTMLLLAGFVWRTAAAIDRIDAAHTAAERERVAAEAAATAAHAANAAKTQFLAVMSHELRTPLNAVAGYTELLEIGVYGPVTDAQIETLGRIRRAGKHLLVLVDQVLTLARTEAGSGVELELAHVAADAILGPVEVLILPQCRAKAIRYDAELAGHDVVFHGDQARVEQILLNLLSNALKFTEPGGHVSVRAATEGSAVVFRVVDTGRGVPVAQQEAIFAPFVQAEAGLTRRADGAGLGLAISRELARAMGGDVMVERSDATGSTFTLTLPRGIAEAVEVTTASQRVLIAASS